MPTTPGTFAEVAISNGGYGGDFMLDETGDLVLSIDTAASPQATIERITRLVLTNANVTDDQGNVIGFADDIFHPNWGASTRVFIGENFTDSVVQYITAQIAQALAKDAAIAPVPAPEITITETTPGYATLVVSFLTNDGQPVTLPTINLTPSGATVSGA